MQRKIELLRQAHKMAFGQKILRFVQVSFPGDHLYVKIFQTLIAGELFLEGQLAMASHNVVLIMRKNPGYGLAEKDHVKRVRKRETRRIEKVFAGNASHPRKHFPGEPQILLAYTLLLYVSHVAMANAKAVFEDELKRRARRFHHVQKNHHRAYRDAAFGCDCGPEDTLGGPLLDSGLLPTSSASSTTAH